MCSAIGPPKVVTVLGFSPSNLQNSPGQRPKGVLDPVSACFYSVFFDKWASPGSLGDLSRLPDPFRPPLGKAGIAADDVKIWFSLCFAAPEASKRPFCALDLPTVFRTRFWRSPGSILGDTFSEHVCLVDLCFWSLFFQNSLNPLAPHDRGTSRGGQAGLFGYLFELIYHRCLRRVPSEICLLRALREKGAYGLRPTKTNGFSRFLHVRGAAGHAARKATENNK